MLIVLASWVFMLYLSWQAMLYIFGDRIFLYLYM